MLIFILIVICMIVLAWLIYELRNAVPDLCGESLLIDHDEMEDMGYKVKPTEPGDITYMSNMDMVDLCSPQAFHDMWHKAEMKELHEQGAYLYIQGMNRL